MGVDYKHYKDKAREKAADAVRYMIDDVVEQLIDSRKAEDSITDEKYGSVGQDTEHEWGEEWFNPLDAIECLSDLEAHEADIEGMYDPTRGWRHMMSLLASLTFSNGCVACFKELIDEINGNIDVDYITEEVKNVLREEKRPSFYQSVEVALMAETDTADYTAADINEMADKTINEWMDGDGKEEVKNRVNVKVEAAVKAIADEYHE